MESTFCRIKGSVFRVIGEVAKRGVSVNSFSRIKIGK